MLAKKKKNKNKNKNQPTRECADSTSQHNQVDITRFFFYSSLGFVDVVVVVFFKDKLSVNKKQ